MVEPHRANEATALALLRDALVEAQTNVRAYDTKAQIVSVGYIFALGIVENLHNLLPTVDRVGVDAVLVTWAVVIMPVALFGHVLYPSRRVAPEVERDAGSSVRHLLYIDGKDRRSVRELGEAARAADPLDETGFELLKVSRLRDVKRRRFLRALFAALFAFGFLFLEQMTRVLLADA